MIPLRLVLLASCVALPALAQQVPAIDNGATANANAGGASATAAFHQGAGQQAAGITNAALSQGNLQGTIQGQGTVPRTMPPPIDPVAANKPLSAKERAGLNAAHRWIARPLTPHLDEDGVVHFAGRGQVIIVTAVNHVTDIALAPGEIISPPLHIGDADDWRFHPATSGSGRKTIEHVLVKPGNAGLSTNMVLETNKRTISVALTSRREDYMPLVALDIPEDPNKEFAATATLLNAGNAATAAAASPCDQQPVIPPDQFRISGDTVTWRPVQAYVVSTPVGLKTCIDFPSSIGSEDLPALLTLADDGGWFSAPTKKIVNVRYVHRRFIADERLDRFILVDGVGGDQKSITITLRKPR
nr:TrbG/VirB9 family P-type conjugative transfer protein [uncultured Rhodopila sp.]